MCVFHREFLTAGRHTLQIKVSGERGPKRNWDLLKHRWNDTVARVFVDGVRIETE